jgi:EAL domain-containing protein (putative c-di-GMP-specific phosphodiesterase class I)
MGAELFDIERLLAQARAHLGADVAWLSSFTGGRQVIFAATGDTAAMNVHTGDVSDPPGSYCVRVVAGTLPAAIDDARRHLVTRDLPVTRELNIGAYLGVPWHDDAGEVGGMLCCVSRHPDPSFDERAVWFLEFIAAQITDHFATVPVPAPPADPAEHAVRSLFDDNALNMVFQPIIRLQDDSPEGVEALSRFTHQQFPSPDKAFAAAARYGRGIDLEHLAARQALHQLGDLPGHLMMGVNVSADALLDARVQELLLAHPGRRIAVEITEHTQVRDYLELISVTERLRAAGLLIVIDDAGAGYASLHHILQLRPDIIKLDIALVRGIDADPIRQALTRSLVGFAAEIGAALIAEGIETPAEHDMLRQLRVGYGQGFLLGRPAPLATPAGGSASTFLSAATG